MEMKSVRIPAEAEIEAFVNDSKLIVYKACKEAGLCRADWDVVLNTVAIKFANGKVKFDAKRCVKYSTFLYSIAYNSAMDEVRKQHCERFQDLNDNDWGNICDGHGSGDICAKDEKVIVLEALRRLNKEMKDKTKLTILVRYILNGEDRERLAREYGVVNDYVSLIKTRYIGRLQKHTREVMKEDENGKLVLGNRKEISFLKPYLNW